MRLAAIADELDTVQPVLVRVTVGVEAHTHEFIATAHEDQKFGFSLAGGQALEAVRRVHKLASLELRGLHSHIGSQIFTTSGFDVAAHRLVELMASVRDELGVEVALLDLGGGLGIAYTEFDDPQEPRAIAEQLTAIVRRECAAAGLAVPRLAVEPGRAIAGPPTMTVYEVGTIKPVEVGHGVTRTYVSVDGGMSDNIRTPLYDAAYTCALVSRSSDAAPMLVRVVGKHCESGDVVVKDAWLPVGPCAGRPAGRCGHGCVRPQHGEQLQPRPQAAGGRRHGRRVRVRSCAARPWTTCWPSTSTEGPANVRRSGERVGQSAQVSSVVQPA